MTTGTPAVLCLAPHLEDRLLPQLPTAGLLVVARPAGADEAAEALVRLRPGVLVTSAEPRHLDAALVRAAASTGTALVVLAEGDRGRAHAAALGVGEVLDAAATAADVAARIEQGVPVPVPAEDVPAAAPPGRVTAVWGPAGSPGRTTTAIALAAELAAAGLRVALVDADTIGAAIAPSLGLLDEAPGLAAACRLAAAGALTAAELDRVAQRYAGVRGELHVLTGIGRPARWPELSADRVTAVLEQCRSWADHTVVDTGFNLEADEEIVSDLFAPRRNAATLAAVQAADTVVAVGAGDPIGLARYVRAFGDLVELVDPHRVHSVIGKVRQSAVGLGAGGQIRASLQRFGGIDEVTLVPSDPAAYDAALLTARPLPDAAPRSAATAALRRFAADRLIDRPVRAQRRRVPRLRGLRPAAS
ncbi:regulator [Amnibacterium kyonggiense]|uniref:Cellulose biosynthesis protein BcsQ n=1 Tax=Amnibacterium kyonggiense TaxID=595671 RepID=A0A4R7FEX5_9MICO|nr:regulator [Amnibacterium kyonggiense]TDS74495.1 cellulose biosynthesis protein BcsQ [Amnibacterium kyonggiense]